MYESRYEYNFLGCKIFKYSDQKSKRHFMSYEMCEILFSYVLNCFSVSMIIEIPDQASQVFPRSLGTGHPAREDYTYWKLLKNKLFGNEMRFYVIMFKRIGTILISNKCECIWIITWGKVKLSSDSQNLHRIPLRHFVNSFCLRLFVRFLLGSLKCQLNHVLTVSI